MEITFNHRLGSSAVLWAQVNQALIHSPSPGSTTAVRQLRIVDTRPQLPYRSWLPMLW